MIFGETTEQQHKREQKEMAEAYCKKVRFFCILPRILSDGRWACFEWVHRVERIQRSSSEGSGVTYKRSSSVGSYYSYHGIEKG